VEIKKEGDVEKSISKSYEGTVMREGGREAKRGKEQLKEL
jgi:hypothetical protein